MTLKSDTNFLFAFVAMSPEGQFPLTAIVSARVSHMINNIIHDCIYIYL